MGDCGCACSTRKHACQAHSFEQCNVVHRVSADSRSEPDQRVLERAVGEPTCVQSRAPDVERTDDVALRQENVPWLEAETREVPRIEVHLFDLSEVQLEDAHV